MGMMAIGMVTAFGIMSIVFTVINLIVLIKLFKNEGALKGILGFFCGIYTFIWGWMKHKQLGMTKLMAAWTISFVVMVVIIPVMGISTAMMIPQYLQEASGGDFEFSKTETSKKTPKINWANKKKSAPIKTAQNKSMPKFQNQKVDWHQKALALWQGNRYQDPNKAINYWNRAISSNRNSAEAYSNRGLAYQQLRQYQKAVHDYSQAIKLNPRYAAAYNNRGNSYYEMSEYQLALNDFNQSLKLNPKNPKAYLNRGLAFYQMDNNMQACRDFKNSCDQGDCDGIRWAEHNGICKTVTANK
jgi:Flp pilus assembly protein TadD